MNGNLVIKPTDVRSRLESWRRAEGSSTADHAILIEKERDAAVAANAAKSRFLASVSHEIRSPLNSIYGYAQLLERGGVSDTVAAAGVIRRSAEHLINLVEGLLDISQIENGVMKVGREVTRLAPFLDQIANMFRHTAATKGLDFVYEGGRNLPEIVRMDQNRLRQILINLLSNAVKFTSSGSVTLAVSYVGQMASFEIRDTGPGIASEQHETIFAPFERGGDPGTADQPGAGLGLAITRALVEILGGDLQIHSNVGSGSRFRVIMMLPQVSGHVNEAAPAALVTGYVGNRRAVLIVDDDVHQLLLLQDLLGPLGFDIRVASSGETALEIAAAKRFDAVLMDISMPGMSGWDAAQRLRDAAGSGLKIIMLSANAHDRHGREGAQPAHDRFLMKPVEFDGLIDTLGAELDLRWVATPVGPEAEAAPVDAPSIRPLSPVAGQHIRKIKAFTMSGHARAIEQEIKALETADPEARELAARLYDCLDRFDFRALNHNLQPHL